MENAQQVASAAQQSSPRHQSGQNQSILPAVDVFENSHGVTLLADLPGVSKDALEVKVEGESLLIEGTVQTGTPDGLEPVYAEVRVPRYRRSFTLSKELDTSAVNASLKDGVLSLHIPKKAHAQSRKIAVTAG